MLVEPTPLAPTASPAEVRASGEVRSAAFLELNRGLQAEAQKLESAEHALLEKALAIVGDLLESSPPSPERQKLECDIEEQRERAAVYDELAYDLRQDRLVAFLQDQALQILAATGTRHLEELSGGRSLERRRGAERANALGR